MPALRTSYRETHASLREAINTFQTLAEQAKEALLKKRKDPSDVKAASTQKEKGHRHNSAFALDKSIIALNQAIRAHNDQVDDFSNQQESAREAIRKHFLWDAKDEYDNLTQKCASALADDSSATKSVESITSAIKQLENDIRKHGPAAEVINKLIQSYLGHNELKINPIDQGYEIWRHGKIIEGLPSEGEKTAIAVCYFLSMLESDNRNLKDLIVVVDDPVSSLDSRALNFACALLRNRLANVAQFILLTHNQNCLNEFRKFWKSAARSSDGQQPTATLLFLDVSIPSGQTARTSTIIKMPKLLRDYDSEYHFLFKHVIDFIQNGTEYDHAYMMPNVLRRVLDVFLAFRCPGTASPIQKIYQLCDKHELDKDRLSALERLSQVESHSDNLDDLVTFSSMIIEESLDAAKALVSMIETVDPAHLDGLKRICTN